MTAAPRFDLGWLFGAVDDERRRRQLTWAELARELGVSASTIRRYREANDAEADGVLNVLGWLGAAPEDYVRDGAVDGVRLPAASDGVIRVEMAAVARASGDPRGARGRTRTTIQTLVAAAQKSGQPVASLTRISTT